MSRDRPISFSELDEPLRRDVSRLGRLLGDILEEQGGRELFDQVEGARTAAIARRREDGPVDELARRLEGLAPAAARQLVRAFSAYFSLVNLAEQVHRVRRRRDFALDPDQEQPGSLAAVSRSLVDAGIGVARQLDLLRTILVEPVLTAHPTEATRRTILVKEQRVAEELVRQLTLADATPAEQEAQRAALRETVTLMWQTEEQPPGRPTVADEVEHAVFYLSDVVYGVSADLHRELGRALTRAGGGALAEPVPWPAVHFASWVGGDMDGNPNVGAHTIRGTLKRQRDLVLERYRREVRALFDRLSQSRSRVGFDDEVLERCDSYRVLLPEVWQEIPERYRQMPYRTLLWLMWARLEATKEDAAEGYGSPAELADDLELIASSLRSHQGTHAGLAEVENLLRRLDVFGFHLATLDVRQDSLVHRRVVGELLAVDGFADLPGEERTRRLQAALGESAVEPPADPSEECSSTLDVFEAIAAAQSRYGGRAIGPYIISMAHGADDVLAVLFLARAAGLVGDDGRVPLDIAPLVETVDDLERAGSIVEAMLSDPAYRRHLATRNDLQVVMIGYSDSSKISGIAASRWALYEAQEDLVAVAERGGVDLTIFHGRGGTVGRGGSKPREAILAEPWGAVRGRLRVTEQGEMINLRYGLPDIARRTLELMLGGVLEATALGDRREGPPEPWRQAMHTIAETAREGYRGLVYDDADFIAYFRAATPIDVIERMPIGSRPASRRTQSGIDDLRAIPWVFAWMQSRHVLPGWLDLGAGLAAASREHGEDTLRAMAAGWPFFAILLGDVEMVLAKADMGIAAEYARLTGNIGERLFADIRGRFERTRDLVLGLQDEDELLDREPVLKRSIHLRNPYVDPMSLVQVDLLRRWRESGREDPELEQALFTTLRGIARGLRNTG